MSSQDFDDLLALLESSDGSVRNGAALELRELADSRAVLPLLRAIHVPANRDNRGTLLYALQTMDCRGHFVELFDLALHGNYEVRCMALDVLRDQPTQPSPDQWTSAREQLVACAQAMDGTEEIGCLVADLQAILDAAQPTSESAT